MCWTWVSLVRGIQRDVRDRAGSCRASEVQEPLRNIMKMVAPVGLRISVPLTVAFLLSLTYFQSDGLLAE